MNILEFSNINVKNFIVLIMLLLFLSGTGCYPFGTLHPRIEDELHAGKTNDETVYVFTQKFSGEYDYGPRYVWFMLPGKTVWQLYFGGNDPKDWTFTHLDPNGFEENIPLVQYNFSTKDLAKWPTEWNLVPSKKPIKH